MMLLLMLLMSIGEPVIRHRDEHYVDEMQVWMRSALWYQVPYHVYQEQVEPYVEETGIDLSQVKQGISNPTNLPIHGPPFKLDEEFRKHLSDNLEAAMQPGVHSSETIAVQDAADLLSGMPADMSERRRVWSRKPTTFETHEDLQKELLKRLQVADLKFLLNKVQQPSHGNKAAMLHRFLMARSANRENPQDLRGAREELGRLYYIDSHRQPVESTESTAESTEPTGEASSTEPTRLERPSHMHAPVGDAADPAHLEEVLSGILTRTRPQKNPELVYLYIDKDSGKQMVEIFIDLLEVDREKIPLGGYFSVRFAANNAPYDKCPHGVHHSPETCKCHLPVCSVGQDEAIFKSYQMSNRHWTLGHDEGKRIQALRKKGDGIGLMVSTFQDEISGFGLPMSPDNLAKANEKLQAMGEAPLTRSPGVRTLEYGKDRDGYWTMQDMLTQLTEFNVCASIVYQDKFQIVHNFDWSSGHSAMPPKALHALSMNMGFGGKQPEMRNTKILREDGFLGPHPRTLTVGQVQSLVFRPRDAPPWYAPTTPEQDKEETQPDGTKKTIPGYMGKPKGLKQVLWERGLWDPLKPPKVDQAREIIAACFDFSNEETALEKLTHKEGHLLRMSPKGHPEIAGGTVVLLICIAVPVL